MTGDHAVARSFGQTAGHRPASGSDAVQAPQAAPRPASAPPLSLGRPARRTPGHGSAGYQIDRPHSLCRLASGASAVTCSQQLAIATHTARRSAARARRLAGSTSVTRPARTMTTWPPMTAGGEKNWLGQVRGWPAECACPPSSIKRDCDRRTMSTGRTYLADVHPKSRLTLETSASTPVRRRGPGGACPDRTRAIPCKVTRGQSGYQDSS
jgi:hypothetical protein